MATAASREYDRLYKAALAFVATVNPCKPSGGKCEGNDRPKGFCCGGCQYLGAKGCTVKSLTCKLWFCPSAYANVSDPQRAELRALQAQAKRFFVFRGSKADSLRADVERAIVCG